MSTKDMLFQIQKFLVCGRLNVVQIILCVFYFSCIVILSHTAHIMIFNQCSAEYPLCKPSLYHREYWSMFIEICSLELDSFPQEQ